MSGWVRGIYNAAASFVLSRSLRAASGSSMGRNTKHMRKVNDQPDERKQSCESSESDKHACPCTGTATPCTGTTPCRCVSASAAEHTSFPCAHCRDSVGTKAGSEAGSKAGVKAGTKSRSGNNYVDPDFGLEPSTSSTSSTKGQRVSPGIRASDEPRDFKHSDTDSTDSVERRIGIPAGVTI